MVKCKRGPFSGTYGLSKFIHARRGAPFHGSTGGHGWKAFAAAERKFTELVERLSTEESLRMTHSDLESVIAAEGREIHRRLLQGHLDLRAAEERVRVSVRGADDVERTHHRQRGRGLQTVFGQVTVTRMTYGARGQGSLSPLDASLNLPAELHSHGLRQLAAIEAARGSFDAAVEAL